MVTFEGLLNGDKILQVSRYSWKLSLIVLIKFKEFFIQKVLTKKLLSYLENLLLLILLARTKQEISRKETSSPIPLF